MRAAKDGHAEVTKVLIQAGANVNHQNTVCASFLTVVGHLFSFATFDLPFLST